MKDQTYQELTEKKKQKLKNVEKLQAGTTHINHCIEELEAAKKIIAEKKEDYQDITNALHIFPHEYDYSWWGDVYDQATDLFWNDAQVKAQDISKQMGDRLAVICNEIARLEEQRICNENAMAQLNNELHSLTNKIDALSN